MDTRKKMEEWRNKNNITFKLISLKSGVSEDLLKMIENGHVTHPDIARKIAKAYELSEKEAYDLMPEIHRPDSPKYDPTKYVEPEPDFAKKLTVKVYKPEETLLDHYVYDHGERMRRFRNRESIK